MVGVVDDCISIAFCVSLFLLHRHSENPPNRGLSRVALGLLCGVAIRPPGRGFEVNATTEGLTKGLWLHHWQALDDNDDHSSSGHACGADAGDASALVPAGGAAAEACLARASPEALPSDLAAAASGGGGGGGGGGGSRPLHAWSVPVATLLLDSEGLGAPGGDLRGYDSKLVRKGGRFLYVWGFFLCSALKRWDESLFNSRGLRCISDQY